MEGISIQWELFLEARAEDAYDATLSMLDYYMVDMKEAEDG